MRKKGRDAKKIIKGMARVEETVLIAGVLTGICISQGL